MKNKKDIYRNRIDKRWSAEQKLIARITVATELGRYIRAIELDVTRREDMLFKLVESLDWSEEWITSVHELKLGELYELIQSDDWHDYIPTEEEPDESGRDDDEPEPKPKPKPKPKTNPASKSRSKPQKVLPNVPVTTTRSKRGNGTNKRK